MVRLKDGGKVFVWPSSVNRVFDVGQVSSLPRPGLRFAVVFGLWKSPPPRDNGFGQLAALQAV
jgi:hypothetical protein